MSSILTRALTGAVFVSTLIFCAYFHFGTFFGLFAVFTAIGSKEYLKILKKSSDFHPQFWFGILLSVLTFTGISLVSLDIIKPVTVLLLTPLFFLVFIVELFRDKPNPFSNIIQTILPTFYIAIPFALFFVSNQIVQKGQEEYISHLALAYFFTLWSNDTGAYLAGRAFGKHKLFERISPNKTWEGTIGGVIAAMGICYLCSFFYDSLATWKWLSIGVIIALFGSLGDLVESLFKRSMGVKDSGTLLPGHGGVLDRFDSLIMASPFVFTFLILTELILK